MYVASSFATGHHDKASDTSVWDYEKAAYSLPTHCHLFFLVHLDMQKVCNNTMSQNKCAITIYCTLKCTISDLNCCHVTYSDKSH